MKSSWEPYWWTMPVSGAKVERERCLATLVRVEVPVDAAIECKICNVSASRSGAFHADVYTSDPSVSSSPSSLYSQTMGTTSSPGTISIPYSSGYEYGKTYWVRIHYEPSSTLVGNTYTATFDLKFSRKDGSGSGSGSGGAQAVLSSIAISGSSELFPGGYTNYICMATMSDGYTRQVNASWSILSAPAKRAVIFASGRLESNKWSDLTSPVDIVIQASYTEGGVTKTATKNVTILVPISTITISGDSSINACGTKAYSCFAKMADGTTKKVAAKWSIESGGSYGSISPDGILNAKSTAAGKEIVIKASHAEGVITCTRTMAINITEAALSLIIPFESNGGTECGSERYFEGSIYGSLPTTTRTGYTFDGWYTSSSFKTKVTASSTVSSSVYKLYAKWTANTYSVLYNYNGGTKGANNPSAATYGTAFYVSAPTRSGQTFAGWTVSSGLNSSTAKWGTSSSPSTSISSSGTKCANGATGNVHFINLTPTASGSVTLTANWTSTSTYTVTYKPGAYGSGSQQIATKNANVALTLKGETFTRKGYKQTGWTTSDGGAKAYNLSASYTANAAITLYPVWTANTYTVKFNPNGGTGTMSNMAMTYDVAKNLPRNGFSKSGSDFAGWATTSDGGVFYQDGAKVNNLTTTQGATMTLYAKWKESSAPQPTLTINSEGVLTKVVLNGSTAVAIPSSVKSIGYKAFDGLDELRSVTIPDSVTDIGGWAFLDCSNLTSVTIPASVRTIGSCPFLRCHKLSSIGLASGNGNFKVIEGALIDIANGILIQYAPGRRGACEISSSVGRIGWAAFSESRVTSVTLPENLSYIEAWAFSSCADLVNINFLGNAPMLDMSGGSGSAFNSVASSCVVSVPRGSTGWNTDIPGTWQGVPIAYQASVVAFNANGGACSLISQTYTIGDKYSALPLATRQGYSFAGWFTTASGGVKVTSETVVSPVPRQTLFAHWTPLTYKVAFNKNGGKLPKGKKMAAQTLTYGKAAKLRKNVFTRKGYVFAGWATSKANAKKGLIAYKNAQSVNNLRADGGTTTLYAVWAKKTYKVAFYANGGKGKMAVEKFTYGKAKKLTANKFKRKGYTFKGWAKSKALAQKGTVTYRNKQAVKNLVTNGKTVKLYAVWKKQ